MATNNKEAQILKKLKEEISEISESYGINFEFSDEYSKGRYYPNKKKVIIPNDYTSKRKLRFFYHEKKHIIQMAKKYNKLFFELTRLMAKPAYGPLTFIVCVGLFLFIPDPFLEITVPILYLCFVLICSIFRARYEWKANDYASKMMQEFINLIN